MPDNTTLRSTLVRRSNALVLLIAGKRYSPWVALEHTGRRSGHPYRTPLVTFVFEDGFVIMLPYGPGVDWCRNVMASGRATLIRKGQTHNLERPHIVPVDAEVRTVLPRSLRFMASESALLLHPSSSR